MKKTFATISVARGLTVLMMPAVHTVMMYSKPEVYLTWWAYVLRFVAEGPGAQLFMFIMGFFLAVGKPKSRKLIMSRSSILLLSGYLLNFFRTYIPARLGMLPKEMLIYYGAGSGRYPYLPLLLTGDILQFAGIAYGIVGWVSRRTNPLSYCCLFFVLFAAGAPFLWGLHSPNILVDHLLALVCADDSRAFFPLFPWLCYPMAGLVAGFAFIRSDQQLFFGKLATAGLLLMITGIVIMAISPTGWERDFYRSGPGRTLAYTGFVPVWLCLIHQWILHTSGEHPLTRISSFCSRHITLLYCLHWLIVCWCLPLAGYHHLNQPNSIFAICIVSSTSFGLIFFFLKIRQRFRLQKEN